MQENEKPPMDRWDAFYIISIIAIFTVTTVYHVGRFIMFISGISLI